MQISTIFSITCITVFFNFHLSDENECERRNGGCEHDCTNNEGSFTCSCRKGWKLGPDERSCLEPNIGMYERSCLEPNIGMYERSCLDPNIGMYVWEVMWDDWKLGPGERSCLEPNIGMYRRLEDRTRWKVMSTVKHWCVWKAVSCGQMRGHV